MEVSKGKRRVLDLGRNNPMHQDRLAQKQFCRKDAGG